MVQFAPYGRSNQRKRWLGGDNQDENRIASPELLPNHDSCLA